MFNWNKKIIPLLGVLYLVALCFFIWGLVAGSYKIFPWELIANVVERLHAIHTFKGGPEKSLKEKVVLDVQEYPKKYDFSGFRLRDNDFHDDGYLLISRYSKKHGQVIVDLFSIADNKIIHTWIPQVDELLSHKVSNKDFITTPEEFHTNHPLLLKDGGIIFNDEYNFLVKLNKCSYSDWINTRVFHHSIEFNHNGNIVTCIVVNQKINSVFPIRNDGIAIVSPQNGNILHEYSITDALLKNGYRGLLYGIGLFEDDRIHLNDAQPVLRNTEDARIGDILISMRHISSVALFRPNTGEIIWMKTGPWLNQHDINLLSDNNYSIFGNDVARKDTLKGVFVEDNMSEIYIFNPIKNIISNPYTSILRKEKIATETGGRAMILGNKDAFLELSDHGRLIRISKDKVRWEYENFATSETVGALHWSRYIPKKEIDLDWLKDLQCN